jgi:hypothetical protein
MEYKLVYDISVNGYKEWFYSAVSGGLVLAGIGILFFFENYLSQFGVPALSLIVFACMVVMPVWDHTRLKQALLSGQCLVAEGKVENYWQKDWYASSGQPGKSCESFTVQGVTFTYYRTVSAAGFRNQEGKTVQIQNGMQLRVQYLPEKQHDFNYIDNRILKLEKQ